MNNIYRFSTYDAQGNKHDYEAAYLNGSDQLTGIQKLLQAGLGTALIEMFKLSSKKEHDNRIENISVVSDAEGSAEEDEDDTVMVEVTDEDFNAIEKVLNSVIDRVSSNNAGGLQSLVYWFITRDVFRDGVRLTDKTADAVFTANIIESIDVFKEVVQGNGFLAQLLSYMQRSQSTSRKSKERRRK